MGETIINMFIPRSLVSSHTERELMKIFVFTHLLGPLIAQPMVIYLYVISPSINAPMTILTAGVCAFWALPFLLRYTGDLRLCATLSFVGLTSVSLFGTYFYGNLASPFLPWLIVSLLLGFFYLSKNVALVIGLFSLCVGVFSCAVLLFGLPTIVDARHLQPVAWLSIVAASIYMSWMVVYYAQICAMRMDLSAESERYQATLAKLRSAHGVAEETSRKRSAFFAKMSHELRTPLNVIIGFSEILIEDVADEDGEDAASWEDLQRINKAANHLLSLISHVLDEETGETQLDDLDVTEFALSELVADIEATARPMIESNGNEFVIHCVRSCEILWTDRTRVRQILLNLLSNAGKFTQAGKVTLSIEVDKIGIDTRIRFSIADTGIGITPEAMGRLFQDYMQADASISGRFGGTGIGLALTRQLCILLGGDVSVESTPGAGSTFTVEIAAEVNGGTERAATLQEALAGDEDDGGGGQGNEKQTMLAAA